MKYFILADTSYGEDGVDEVAAEHVGAQLIVHYGRASFEMHVLNIVPRSFNLLRPRSTPVYFVPGCGEIDVEKAVASISRLIERSEELLVFYDGVYAHKAKVLESEFLKRRNPGQTHVAHVKLFVDPSTPPEDVFADKHGATSTFCGRNLPILLDSVSNNCSILYVGGEDATLTNIALAFSSSTVHCLDSYNAAFSLIS